MNMLPFILAWRYLNGRRLRALLTMLAITLGVTLVFGMNSLVPTVMDSMRRSSQVASDQVDLTIQQRSGLPFAAALAREVAAVPGVVAATPLLRQSFNLPTGSPLATVTLIGVEPETLDAVSPLRLEQGRGLEVGDELAAVLPASVAARAGLALGDTLALPASAGTMRFAIVGLSQSPPLPGSSEVYVPLAAAQRLFNQADQANALKARFETGREGAAISEAVQARLGERFSLQAPDSLGAFGASMEAGQAAIALFGMIALAMGAFIIFNSFRTAVTERQRDIGLLRAVGASRRTVLITLLAEGLLLGLLGTAAGLLLGYGMALLGLAGMQNLFGDAFGMQLDGIAFSLPLLLLSLALGIGTAVAGSLLPAWGATRVTPLEALRPSRVEVVQPRIAWTTWLGALLVIAAIATLLTKEAALATLGALLFLAGLALLTPLLMRPVASGLGRLLTLLFAREGMLAQGNLERQPGRAAVTASAVMIGMAVVVALAGLTSSIVAASSRAMEQTFRADFLLMPSSLVLASGNLGAGPELAEALRRTPGVEEVATLKLALTQAEGQSIQLLGIDPVSYPRLSGLLFSEGQPDAAYQALAEGDGMIVNGFLASLLAVGVGDSVTVETAQGPMPFPVVGVASDFLNLKAASGFISQGALSDHFGPTNDVMLMANAAPDADAGATLRAVEATAAPFPAFTVTSSDAWRGTMEQLMSVVAGVYYGLMFVLALPALLALANTLAMNVLERTRELGLLRAVGAARRQVQRMILAESLLLSAAGTAFGILAGLWLGRALLIAMTTTGFNIVEYSFPAAGLLIVVAVGLLFGVLAALLPAHRAARLDIVRALQYE